MREIVPPASAPSGWRETYEQLAAADRQAPLPPMELVRLAIAAYLIGRDTDSAEALTRAHHAFLEAGQPHEAARSAFWLGFSLLNQGERAQAAGWFARSRRVLDEGDHDCAERGYLLLPVALQHAAEGALPAAQSAFAEAAAIGERFGDPDLIGLARQGCGRALIGLGHIAEGVALLDEVMVAATSGELSPSVAGTVYCGVISACFDIFDVRRAQEWTDALDRWCASQPDLVPYRGSCRVHRAEIMLLHGVWPDAIEEARRACAPHAPAADPAAAAALYQLGELHRLRGEYAEAEEAYRMAAEAGRHPHPGLALMRLAQGRLDTARAAICRVMDEARDRRMRTRVLPAFVEILLAAGDVSAARAAANELSRLVAAVGTPFLKAVAASATAAVLLAEGDAKQALSSAREAWTIWRDLEAPYEAARATVLVGLACRAVGDCDSGDMELAAARRAFHQLGAVPDVARVDALVITTSPARAAGPLTARELQVIRLIASGKTNRAIADELDISEKTVARHISNIFTKLDLSTRAAATAYAFKHHLVGT